MSLSTLPLLLDATQLHTHITEQSLQPDNLVLVHVGSAKEYLNAHLPHAVFCDYMELIGDERPAVGNLPPLALLESSMSTLGIDKNTHVIAYDSNYGAQASRLLWTLEYLGHPLVSVLDGGLQNWAAQGFDVSQAPVFPTAKPFTAHVQENCIANTQFIVDNLDNPSIKLIDARTPEEYKGIKSNPLRKGHIPGALHLNWQDNIDPFNFGCLKPAQLIQEQIDQIGIKQDNDIIVYCQTHQRSSHLYMVLRSLGYCKVRGYPGSWARWGNDTSLPIEL